MSPPTIHDIARQAGVCIGTVSRVLNNKDRVHPRTRERIRCIIEQTGYQPSAMGRGLVTRRSHNVMLLVHNIADPHCIGLAKHLSRLCRARGYRLLVGDSDYEPALEAECLRDVHDGSADGLLVSPLPGAHSLPLFRKLTDARFPMVALMNAVPGTRIPCVKYDDLGAGRLATDYLLGRGHRQIGFAGWHLEFQTVRDRYQGYVESHRRQRAVVRPALRLQLPKSLDQVQAHLAEALALTPPPTAILAINEMVALTCVNALAQLHRRVPEDIAVMAFGDQFPAGAAPLPITTVSWGEDALSDRALEVLLGQMPSPGPPKRQAPILTLQPRLMIRASA